MVNDATDQQLLLDVVTTLTINARRVVGAAVDAADTGDPAAVRAAVVEALDRETRAIVAGVSPDNRPLVSAVESAGRALQAVAVQALQTSVAPPAEALDRAFELFGSYLAGSGREQILTPPADG